MGWYGGQNGAQRLRSKTALEEAFSRFRGSIMNNNNNDNVVDMVNLTNNLQDNNNFDTIQLLMHNPSTQQEIMDAINAKKVDWEEGATGLPPLAVAIPFSHHLQDFAAVDDSVAERLVGLFVFGAVNVQKEAMMDFIRRCPNLKYLLLAGMDDMDEKCLKEIFQGELVKDLEFLEVSHADDDAVAAMVTAPKLRKIVFRWANPSITNDGFERLVEAGGGKEIVAISAGTLKKDLSKTLTQNVLKNVLPKFVAGQARESNLEHISVGKMYRPRVERQAEALGLQIPSKMNKKELEEAFADRGLALPEPSTVANLRKELLALFNLDEAVALNDKKKKAAALEKQKAMTTTKNAGSKKKHQQKAGTKRPLRTYN